MSETINTDDFLLLATVNGDLGLVSCGEARACAAAHANETGETVFIRDPIEDGILATVKPSKKGAR